jgi:hypothetical protein
MYYEVTLIPMGYMKNDLSSSTADESEWLDPGSPDMYNVLIAQHMDDDSGEVEVIWDFDFPTVAKQYAESNYHMMKMMADYANEMGIPFGSVKNPHV